MSAMNVDLKLKATVASYLDPKERVQAVAAGQTVEPFILANAVGVGVIAALGLWGQFPQVIATLGMFGHVLIAAVIIAIPMFTVLAFTRFRIIAVTDRRIVLLRSGMLKRHRAKGVVGVAPRDTQLLKSEDSVSVRLPLEGHTKPTTIYVRHAALPPLAKADQWQNIETDLRDSTLAGEVTNSVR
jgi:hypothetical protein